MPFDVPPQPPPVVSYQKVPVKRSFGFDIEACAAKVTRFEPKVPLQPLLSLDLSIDPYTYEAAKCRGVDLQTVKSECAYHRYAALEHHAKEHHYCAEQLRKQKIGYMKKRKQYFKKLDITLPYHFCIEAILKDKSLFCKDFKEGTQNGGNPDASELKNGDMLAAIKFEECRLKPEWLYVSFLYVEPAAQRKHLGTLLLQSVAAIASLNDKERMIVLPIGDSLPFYEKKGFSADPDALYPNRFRHLQMKKKGQDGLIASTPLSPKQKEVPARTWHKLHSPDPASLN